MQPVTAKIQALLDGPALAAPDGRPSVPTNPYGNGQLMFSCMAICATFVGIFLIIRYYTQLRVNRRFETADCKISTRHGCMQNLLTIYRLYRCHMCRWFCCTKTAPKRLHDQLLTVCCTIFSVLAVRHSWGVHQWQISRTRLFELLYVSVCYVLRIFIDQPSTYTCSKFYLDRSCSVWSWVSSSSIFACLRHIVSWIPWYTTVHGSLSRRLRSSILQLLFSPYSHARRRKKFGTGCTQGVIVFSRLRGVSFLRRQSSTLYRMSRSFYFP